MATAKEKLIASAQKLVEKGAFEKAIKEYLRVVQEDDSDVRIWLKIGDLYAKIGKKTEATDTYQRVAQFYSNQGFYLKSVAVYKQILKLEPRLVEVNQRLADLYKQLGLISDAISQFEQVAGFYHKEGRVKEALGAMKQIVDLDPEAVAARIKLAEMYSREQMPRDAIEEFTKAADALKEAGRLDEYMKVAERLLFHAPDNKGTTKELARLYIEKNDPRRALPKLQVLFKNDPRDPDVLRLLARAFEGLEQRPKAVSVYKELARILNETGDVRASTDVFRQILAIQPDDVDATNALKGTGPQERRPTIPPSSQPILSNSGPARAHATGAERALDSSGPRAMPQASSTSQRNAIPRDVPPPDRVPDTLAEEIGKILSETDVYIKYNLHAKAIEHLQRVFERQPRHVAAREKLKALYITVGRRDDAITELWALHDHADPQRARRYVREIFELDPSNQRAAQMLGESAQAPGAHAEPEVAADDDFGVAIDSDFGLPTARPQPATRRASVLEPEAESVEDLSFADVSEVSEPIDDSMLEDDGSIAMAEVDEELSGLDLAEVSDELSQPMDTSASLDDDLIPVVIDTGSDSAAMAVPAEDEDSDRFSLDSSDDDEPAPLESSSFGDKASPEEQTRLGSPTALARELGEPSFADETSFAELDAPEDATGLMSAPERMLEPELTHEPDFGTPLVLPSARKVDEPPRAKFAPSSTLVTAADDMDFSSMSDEAPAPAYADPLPEPEPEPIPPPPEPHTGSQRRFAPAPIPDPLRQESSLEDDLDESDFFMQQNLFDEARSMLGSLLERYPNHPLVLAKLKDLDGMDPAAAAEAAPEHLHSSTAEVALPPLESSEVPALDDGVTADQVEAPREPVEVTRRGVVVERGVSAEDLDTHYDLGIAYKEMGLIDDAVAEFRVVMKDPLKEVQCHIMIGLCYLEKKMFTEAINQFKKGLYVEGITDAEALSLYYDLGGAYEQIGDPREALYYYDKVQKRDPKFRDLPRRMRTLRGEEAGPPDEAPSGSDFDDAFDSLTGDG